MQEQRGQIGGVGYGGRDGGGLSFGVPAPLSSPGRPRSNSRTSSSGSSDASTTSSISSQVVITRATTLRAAPGSATLKAVSLFLFPLQVLILGLIKPA